MSKIYYVGTQQGFLIYIPAIGARETTNNILLATEFSSIEEAERYVQRYFKLCKIPVHEQFYRILENVL